MTRGCNGRIGARFLALAFLLALSRTAAAEEPGESATLLAQAERLDRAGRYADGIKLAERALALREAALGAGHPGVAAALHRLALLVFNWGDTTRAEILLQRSLAIRERSLGPAHLDSVQSMSDLGRVITWGSDFAKAEPLLLRALAARQRAFGREDPLCAEVLAALSRIYFFRGEYQRALEATRKSIAIYERAGEARALDLVLQLMNLANRMANLGGSGSEQEELLRRAIQVGEASGGLDHPVLVFPLMNLALVYVSQGDFERARARYLRAAKIAEASLGPMSPRRVLVVGNLKDLDRYQGDYSSFEPCLPRAEEHIRDAQGLDGATSLHDWADVCRNEGHFAEAVRMLVRARALIDAKSDPNNKYSAKILAMLARVYHEQSALEKAEEVYRQAIPVWEATAARSRLEVAPHLGFAALLASTGRPDAGAAVLLQMLMQGETRLRLDRRRMSDAQLGFFLRKLRDEEELTYSLLRRHPKSAALQRLALSFALLRKGRSIEELAGTSRAVARDLSPVDQQLFADLRTRYGRLASLSLAGPGRSPAAHYEQTLKELTTEADRLEQELATRSYRIRAQRRISSPEEVIGQVAARLPKDGALIEIVAYADGRIRRGPLYYLALVLRSDGRIASIDLGPAGPIDEAAARLRGALQNPSAPYQAAAQELERRVLHPLRSFLDDTRQVFLSPDGALHQIPFAVLRADDSLSFSYLTSGRDLLREVSRESAITVAVLADPDFRQAAAGPPGAGSSERDRGLSVGQLRPLPGTRTEAEAIRRLLPDARLLLGKEATEATLLGLRAPGILHIATHGLFLDEAPAPPGAQRGFQLRATTPTNPLLRSALVLAGAQQASQQGNSPDGLATALELSGMDLWGTQLVVLSACETGRGEARMGQGVYGLRRALAIAGAETLVTSLWKVDDDATKDLMTDFYRGLVSGQGRGEAMTAAMTKMRARKPHPYYWAPFIVIGQSGPLRGIGAGPSR